MLLAIKAFFRALRDRAAAQRFVLGEQPPPVPSESCSLALLSFLQKQGRLIDFLQEDITHFSDVQIGAAARKIHQDCSKALKQYMTLKPCMAEAEGQPTTIVSGYNPDTVKVVGHVKGSAPYRGVVRHQGWKVTALHVPQHRAADFVLYPAEVEVMS